MAAPPSPAQIAKALEKRVVGQKDAVREMSVALAKKLAGLKVGNILLIGSSGSGKTTLMRAVEELLAANQGPGQPLDARADPRQRARRGGRSWAPRREVAAAADGTGPRAARQQDPVAELVEQAAHGLVFVDEVDKIRSQVGGQPNVPGIRAQEALLTLIENESVAYTLPEWAGGATVNLDSSGVLFVCAGAFEGLYDSVYYRVTAGKDQGALKPVTVVDEGGRAREELQFSLRDWLKTEDLFEYGMSPQFLSRFDAVVLLESLSEETLAKIFAEGAESGLRQSQAYFASFGCKLEVTAEAAQAVVREAARKPRLGARALKEVFRRVVSPLEFDPQAAAGPGGVVRVDLARVKQALAADRHGEGPASTTAGWDQSFRG